MANETLKDIYEKIFNLIYPNIKNQKRRGVLYYVIHELLRTDETEESQADKICNRLDIKKSSRLEDDQKLGKEIIKTLETYEVTNIRLKTDIEGPIPNPLIGEEDKMKWIIVVACTLVGVAACVIYIIEKENKKAQQQTQKTGQRKTSPSSSQPVTQPPQAITAALGLVVPASVITNLRVTKNSAIDLQQLEILIDNAAYFFCKNIEDIHSKENRLDQTEEDIPTDGNQEVYIRINIPNGQDMIDKTSTYILKRNLPSNGQKTVKQLTCLRTLSGLEDFTRI